LQPSARQAFVDAICTAAAPETPAESISPSLDTHRTVSPPNTTQSKQTHAKQRDKLWHSQSFKQHFSSSVHSISYMIFAQ